MAKSADRGPVRTCIGCRAKKTPAELVRTAVDAEGFVIWDRAGGLPGRGAWVCPDENCVTQALARRRFSRAFRRPVRTEKIESSHAPAGRESTDDRESGPHAG